MNIKLGDKEYELATTLRVAYKIQGMNDNKPYLDVFANIGNAGLEDQINLLYAAFSIGNPEEAKTITQKIFLNNVLDEGLHVDDLIEMLNAVTEGIMGPKLIADAKKSREGEDEETKLKNA